MTEVPHSRPEDGERPQPAEGLSSFAREALRHISTATITTQLMDRGLRNTFIESARALNGAARERERMVGQAFTLRYIPAREDLDVLSVFRDYDHPQRKAIESVPAGMVLVIDARGQTRAASLGHILATRLSRRGVAGIVTDGTVRDAREFRSLDLPTFAAGAAPTTNLALHHALEMSVPIGCGEVPIYPGDVMVGDEDGVVCIPQHLADDVARDGSEQERLEEFVLQRIEDGRALRGTYPPDATTLEEYRTQHEDRG